MKKKIFSVLFALVLVLTLGLVTAVPVAANTDRLVPNPYATIQAAIDDADPGDTIIVADTYNSNLETFPITVNVADLTIQAASSPVIDGGGTDWVPAVEITATGVTLQGFTISNFDANAANDYGAVSVVQGVGATIQGNTIYNIGDTEPEPFGIGIDVAANDVDVIGNTVYDTGSIGIRVYGPFGGTTTGVLVENNVVYQTGNTGVVFANTVSNSVIRGNTIYNSALPTPYNLFLCWGFDKEGPPSDILIEGNTIYGGYGNVVLAGAEDITITGNTITGAVPLTTNGKNIYILSDYLQGTHYLSTNIEITNNNITNAEGYGVRIAYTGGTPADGLPMASTTTINNNNISGNTDYGVENTIATTVDAENNWWGATDGPSLSPGSGDRVSDYVDYDPWLGSPIENGAVSMTAASEDAVIGISVSPAFIDFGAVTSGANVSGSALTVSNTGNVGINVDAEIIADTFYNGNLYFYTAALRLNGAPSDKAANPTSFGAWELTGSGKPLGDQPIEVNGSRPLTTELQCPQQIKAATTYIGTVVFWAEQA